MTLPVQLEKLVRFGAVGVLTAAIYFGILWLGRGGLHLDLPVAGALAYAVALPVNYLLHRNWTFRSSRSHGDAAPRYAVNFVWGLTVNFGFLHAARDLPPLPMVAVQLAAIVCLSVSSYLIMAAWVFVAGRAAPARA